MGDSGEFNKTNFIKPSEEPTISMKDQSSSRRTPGSSNKSLDINEKSRNNSNGNSNNIAESLSAVRESLLNNSKEMRQVSKASESSSKYIADSQFLNTMKLNTKKDYSSIPQFGLFPFIAAGNIDILRRELIYRGPRDVFLRDEEFRGPLHFAIALKSSSAPQLVALLFNCFFELSTSKFTEDMAQLEYEKEACVESVLLQTMAKPQMGRSRKTKSELHMEEMEAKRLAMAPINAWFDAECRRNYTIALIRNEVSTSIRYS